MRSACSWAQAALYMEDHAGVPVAALALRLAPAVVPCACGSAGTCENDRAAAKVNATAADMSALFALSAPSRAAGNDAVGLQAHAPTSRGVHSSSSHCVTSMAMTAGTIVYRGVFMLWRSAQPMLWARCRRCELAQIKRSQPYPPTPRAVKHGPSPPVGSP